MRLIAATLALLLAVSGAGAQGAQSERSTDPEDYKGWRHFAFTRKAASGGNKLETRSATYFGTRDNEEFVGCGTTPDGRIVAFGNAWGASFPEEPEPLVLGKGAWYEVLEYRGGRRRTPSGKPARLAHEYPNKAGFIAFYSADLQKLHRTVRFDWGVAEIDSGIVAEDGSLIIAGRCLAPMRALGKSADHFRTVPEVKDDPRHYGPIYFAGVKMPGDVYVAKLSPDASKVRWVWIFRGHRDSPGKLWPDDRGGVWFSVRGLKHLDTDGKKLREIPVRGGVKAVNKHDGRIIAGGDRNSGTGREPWRRPVFRCYRPDGSSLWQVYDWPGPLVGHDDFRLVSDSSLRTAAWDADGQVLFTGWSDGGNTVWTRSPIDLEKSHGGSWGFGMSSWGAGVGSFAHFARFDPTDFDVKAYCFWASYMIFFDEDQPNSAMISEILPLRNGSVAFRGAAASGYIQTPNAYYPDQQASPERFWYGGRTIGVFNRDFTNLRFSSYVPGCSINALCEGPEGSVVFVGSSRGDDGRSDPTPSPSVNALQPKFAGGRLDAHIILLAPKQVEGVTP